MIRLLQTVCIASLLPLLGQSRISVDAAFDNGHATVIRQTDSLIELHPSANLHFRITGVRSGPLHFVIPQGKTHLFTGDHRMVCRPSARREWIPLPPGYLDSYDNYHFILPEEIGGDTVFIAYWHPWTYENMMVYLDAVSLSPRCRYPGDIHAVSGGLPVMNFQISDWAVPDEGKHRIVIIARQHAHESPGNWALKGLVDYLAFSGDHMLRNLLRQAVFLVYPMADAEGVRNGAASAEFPDPNECWFEGHPAGGGVPSDHPATHRLRDMIWQDTGGKADIAIDIHAHPGYAGQCYWWGVQSGTCPEKAEDARSLIAAIAGFDLALHPEGAIVRDHISRDVLAWPGPWADHWFTETLGAAGFTLEIPSRLPDPSLERLTDLGKAIALGLAREYSGSDNLPLTMLISTDSLP
ncbi:MAG: hypothetical protein JW861_08870 [Bacteroidales bacterium]|nr:hypothetical protein [Bacteroidales bacterium]